MKHTYRHWVNNRYYEFKTRKVYWAFLWHTAEEIDKRGVLGGTKTTKDIRFDMGYRFRYLPAGSELDYYRSLNPSYH